MIDNNKFISLNKYALKLGDIVIARRGEMGRCAVVRKENSNWLCGTGCFVIRINPQQSDSDFVNIILSSSRARQHLETASIGATMNNLNQTIISELRINVPSLKEQQKIASALSSIDDVIIAQHQKLEALQLHKKGLLQGLFPNVNEVTA
jgi:restriction endonuclease S subunit